MFREALTLNYLNAYSNPRANLLASQTLNLTLILAITLTLDSYHEIDSLTHHSSTQQSNMVEEV